MQSRLSAHVAACRPSRCRLSGACVGARHAQGGQTKSDRQLTWADESGESQWDAPVHVVRAAL
eukprot:9468068-Pyramimonas_sp.AAC.1